MSIDRKTFLRITGCGLAAALAGSKIAGRIAEAQDELTAPDPAALKGRRWAMVIDTKKCLKDEGCDKCIRACHRVHNVPEIADARREVKWIWKEPFEHAFTAHDPEHLPEALAGRPVLVFCNHCDAPPCVRVCPTKATWKRATDGVVMMDWHRCIGCRYCVAACPYGSRSFNWSDPRPHLVQIDGAYPTRTKGVVEKCTFCDERLARGQLPACVEACTEKALVFGDLADPASEARRLVRENFTLRRKPELGTAPQVFYLI